MKNIYINSMGTFIGKKSIQKGKIHINFTTGAASGAGRKRVGKGI